MIQLNNVLIEGTLEYVEFEEGECFFRLKNDCIVPCHASGRLAVGLKELAPGIGASVRLSGRLTSYGDSIHVLANHIEVKVNEKI